MDHFKINIADNPDIEGIPSCISFRKDRIKSLIKLYRKSSFQIILTFSYKFVKDFCQNS